MSKLEYFLQEVSKKNPIHYRQINKVAVNFDKQWVEKANIYLNKFEKYLNNNNKTLDYGIECYLKVVNDMVKEQYKFLKTGEYSCKNMKDAINSYIDKKLKEKETVSEAIEELKTLLNKQYEIRT